MFQPNDCFRMEVVLILLLLCYLTSVYEFLLFETEEDKNITLQWDSPTEMDLSSLHMNCRFMTVPVKLVFEMVRGEEKPQYQDRQFSGRVQCDREALRLGQVQLHLTRLTPQDSGEYRCEMAANYDSDKGGWRFISTENFKLIVTPKAPFSVATAPGDDENKRRETPEKEGRDLVKIALTVLGVLAAVPVFMFGVMFIMRQAYS